jgi:flap endonuclease-1
MGVKHLNKFLRMNTTEAVIKTHLEHLSGWVIAIDTSNYLYRFAKSGSMLHGLYNMINTLRRYEIVPIFVIDGPPPPEKKTIINERRKARYDALEKYKKLRDGVSISGNSVNYTTMREYKMNSTYVSRNDIMNAVTLMDLMGVNYVKAKGEADQLCSLLTIKGIAHACMSEDMDMFIYGTNTILRYLSLVNENVVIYDYNTILRELDIPKYDFTSICILSGTDYNKEYKYDDVISIFDIMHLYDQYRKNGTTSSFVKWAPLYSHNIQSIDIGLFNQIIANYDILNHDIPDVTLKPNKAIRNVSEIVDFINKCVK